MNALPIDCDTSRRTAIATTRIATAAAFGLVGLMLVNAVVAQAQAPGEVREAAPIASIGAPQAGALLTGER